MLFTGMTIFLVISTIYPNGHYLRPTTFAWDNLFVHMVKCLYATDTATNLFPSIHVYNSIAVNLAVWHSENFRDKKVIRIGSAVLMVSIILSTMFLKQHSVSDVITANIVADVLNAMAPLFGKFLKPDGKLILSGIITERKDEVVDTVTAQGFWVLETREKEGWAAVLVKWNGK